MYTKYNIFY